MQQDDCDYVWILNNDTIVEPDALAHLVAVFVRRARPYLADYCTIRSRLLFTKKYHPRCLPLVRLSLLLVMLRRLQRGQSDRIGMIWRLMLELSREIAHPLWKTHAAETAWYQRCTGR